MIKKAPQKWEAFFYRMLALSIKGGAAGAGFIACLEIEGRVFSEAAASSAVLYNPEGKMPKTNVRSAEITRAKLAPGEKPQMSAGYSRLAGIKDIV